MIRNEFDPIIYVPDDDLFMDDVGIWAKEKYNLVGQYCHVFTKSMKNKWRNLVYLDLFAGSGYSKIRESKKIVKNSALISLSIPFPFTKYILCEKDELRYYTLKERINRDFNKSNVSVLNGDCNSIIDDIIRKIPEPSKQNTVLCFCFADPFSLNLKFSTIKKLSKFKMDFLILLALGMDARRNYKLYLNSENDNVELFLDNKNWRNNVDLSISPNEFLKFLANEFKNNMVNLNYQKDNIFHEVRSSDKNLSLYHLTFFSRDKLGNHICKEVLKYSNGQGSLNF
jgi:three-Cys-motif partner protein